MTPFGSATLPRLRVQGWTEGTGLGDGTEVVYLGRVDPEGGRGL